MSYAANVRDGTDYAWQWKPRKVIMVTAADPPMSFPGNWGAHDETVLVNNAERDPLPAVARRRQAHPPRPPQHPAPTG